MKQIPVIMRKDSDGVVYALFPTLPATMDVDMCTAYARVGQHHTANLDGCIRTSQPAKPDEYESLLAELQDIYCGELIVRQRVSHKMYNSRRDAVKDWMKL